VVDEGGWRRTTHLDEAVGAALGEATTSRIRCTSPRGQVGAGIEQVFVLACPTVVVCQGSLFDSGEPVSPGAGARPPEFRSPREWLDAGAWIEFESNWLAGSHSLFEHMVGTVSWRAERRRMYDRVVDVPRLVAFYGEGDEPPDPVAEVRAALCERYRNEPAGPFRTVGACLYRTGRDSVAWHGDTIGSGSGDDTLVAIVSLGEPRRFLLRPKGGGRVRRFSLGHGDLLVMGGTCQRTWEHAVPKTARAVGPRISVQFRSAGVR
jgi:alkylated DNA repair dioxygenase AlkB